jgi:GcrA cell cycle regulator
MGAHRGAWTSERVEQLQSCFAAGLSCSEIAVEIGATRNAVIGKLNRLGLSRGREVAAPTRERAAAKPPRPGHFRSNAARSRRTLLGLVADDRSGCAGDGRTDIAIHEGRGRSLLELGHGTCRWPINEPGAENFCYCGSACFEGLSYCLGHARLAYRPASRPRLTAR